MRCLPIAHLFVAGCANTSIGGPVRNSRTGSESRAFVTVEPLHAVVDDEVILDTVDLHWVDFYP